MEKILTAKAHVRLELLKLTYNTVHQPEDIIAKTKKLEEFVLEGEAEEGKDKTDTDRGGAKTPPHSGAKKPGNKNEDKSVFS